MTLRKTLLWIILTSFASYSTWVMWQVGYFGIWQAGFTDIAALQILLDLAIGCFLICCWIKGDAESRGMNPYPWMIATLATGTLAPLLYLLIREYRRDALMDSAQRA